MPITMLVVAAFAPMLVEAARAARNEREQRARGGIEPEDDVYGLMRLAYPASFLLMLAEAVARGTPPLRLAAAGGVVFVLAKLLKWWAICTLGRRWTFRILVVPGDARVTRGPYRGLRHPNYLGVVGELAGMAMMANARLAGPVVLIGFGWLLVRRIAIEERMLKRMEENR